MALQKTSIRALGVLSSIAVAAGCAFFVVSPLMDQADDSREQLAQTQVATKAKEKRLSELKEGSNNLEAVKSEVDTFQSVIPKFRDVESASRSISQATADSSGISLISFKFGAEENVEALKEPTTSLDGIQPPFEDVESQAEVSSKDDEEEATLDVFRRVPLIISVQANSYNELAAYLDNLAHQKRFLAIASVKSSGGTSSFSDGASPLSVTIYGYSYVYGAGE